MDRGLGEMASGGPFFHTLPGPTLPWAKLLRRSWLFPPGAMPSDHLGTRPRQDSRRGSSSPDGQGHCSVLSSDTPDQALWEVGSHRGGPRSCPQEPLPEEASSQCHLNGSGLGSD